MYIITLINCRGSELGAAMEAGFHSVLGGLPACATSSTAYSRARRKRLPETFGGKTPILDLSQTRYRRVGGEPKRRGQIDLTRPEPYLPSGDVGVDDQLAIDPAPDPGFLHLQAK